jgi:hypothetical protein
MNAKLEVIIRRRITTKWHPAFLLLVMKLPLRRDIMVVVVSDVCANPRIHKLSPTPAEDFLP